MAQAKMDFIINTKVDKTAFSELRKEIQSLQALNAQDLVKMGAAPDLSSAKSQLAQIQNSANQVEAALNRAFSPKLGSVSLAKFNNELKSLDLQKVANDFQRAGSAGQTAFRDLAANVLTTKVQLKESSKILEEFGQTMTNTIKWGISSSAFNTVTSSIQKAYSYAKNLDTSLNNIRIVAGQSADEMDRFAVKANKAAKELGKNTLDYTNAALIYYQQGTLNDAQIAERTATTLKMANVTGEAAQDVSDYMTAVWNNFYDGSKSVEYYADVMTALGAATASSTDEIAAGLEKFAAIADTVGLSYEYATAALATVTAETRQSADVVGTAFKTMFARIQDLELGETLEDGVTIGSYAEALSKIGVSVLDVNGNMREMDDILNDMGNKWDGLTQAQKVATAEAVAGTRQYTQLIALMDNWDVFQTNINTAANATGTLNEQQEIYMESTRAHLDQLSASAERLYKSLIDSDGVNNLIDIFSGLVTGISEYTEAIGGSGAAMSQLGALATKIFGKSLSQEIATIASNFKLMGEKAAEASAQLKLMQQFRGIEVNDASYQRLLDMTQELESYKDILTETQYQEAQAMIMARNEAANDLTVWEERKRQAEAYFKIFTDKTVDLGEGAKTLNVSSLTEDLEGTLDNYQTKIGDIVKSFKTEFQKGDTAIIESYVSNAKMMINDSIVQNEELVSSLKKSLEKYEKITANSTFEHMDELTKDQKEALEGFVKAYGKAADELVKDTKKVEATIKDAANGAGQQFQGQVDLVEDGWKRMISRFNIQSIAQGFMDLSGQIMMISSSLQSIGNIPSIWKNEDLSTGEKILQTIIAAGNGLNGIAQTMKLVHTTADILTKTLLGNAGATAATAQAQKAQNKETLEAKPIQDELQTELLQSKSSFDAVQKEVAETTQNITSNTLFWDKNTISVRQNTAALVEQYNVRQKMNQENADVSLDDDLFAHLKDDVASNVDEDSIDEINSLVERIKNFDEIKLDDAQIEQLARQYKDKLSQKLKNNDKDIIDLFDLVDDKGIDDAVEGMADKLDDALGEGLTAKDLGLADDIVEGVDKTTEAIKGMGNAAGDANAGTGVFGTFKKDLGVIGKALKMIPPSAWLVVGAIGAIALAWKTFDYYSEENVLKRSLEESLEAAEDAKKAYDDLNTSISNYTNARNSIDDLTEGTVEFYEAIIAANEKAQELIDTLNLMPGYGYTLNADGLIQIDEGVLDAALKRQLNEQYRAQAKVSYNRAALEEYNQKEIVKDFMLAVNQAAAKQGSSSKIDQAQARIILENYNNEDPVWIGQVQRTLEMGNHLGELQNQKLETLDKTGKKNSESICKEVKKGSENTQTSIETNSAVDIGDVISEYSPQYQLSQEKIDAYKHQALLQELYSYLKEEDLKHLTSLDEDDQKSITKIIDNKRENYKQPSIQADKELFWIDAWTAGDKTTWHPGTWFGAWGLRKKANKLKEEYMKNALGYGYDETTGQWTTPEGAPMTEKEFKEARSKINGKTAATAAESGEYYLDTMYQQHIMPTFQKGKSLAQTHNLNSTSQDYITKALLKLQSGEADEKFFDLLTNEEKAILREQMSYSTTTNAISGKSTSNVVVHGIDADSKYSEEDVENFLQDSKDNGRSIERKKADLEEYNNILKSTAESLGTTTDALEFFGIAMHKASKTTDDHTRESAKSIAQQYKFNKAYNEAVSTYYDNEDAIKAYAKAMKNEEAVSYDVADAMGEVATALKDMGLALSADTISEELELVQKLLTGTEEEARKAYEQLYEMAQLDILEKMFGETLDTSKYTFSYKQLIEEINNTEVGHNLSSSYSEQLAKMINETGLTVSQINELAEGLGIEIPVSYDPPESFDLKNVKYTTAAKTVVHSYDGYMPTGKVIDDGNGGKTIETLPVKYSWTETTDERTDEFLVPEKTNMTVTETSKSLGKGSFKQSLGNQKKAAGSGAKPKKENKIEEEKDRYHDINIELKQIANELEKVQEEQDKLVGSDLIANLQRQYNLLNREIDATARKIGIARGEQEELQSKLAGQGVNFNEDGTIANYAEAWDAQLAYVNSVIDKYNSMDAAAQEKYQETLDKAKEDWNKFKENIDRYDTLITDDIPGLESDIRAALDQQIEIKLEAFEYEIKIRLDMSEAEREWNEFKTRIIDGIKKDDILGNAKAKLRDFSSYYKEDGTGEIQASTKQVNNILDQLKQMDADQAAGVYGETYTYTNANGEEVTVDYNNRKLALEDLKEYYTQIMDSMMELQELEEEIHQSYLDMMDEAQEKFDEQLETYQTIDEIIQHDMNLVKLMYGESAGLADYYKEQRKNLDNQLDFQRQQVAFWKNQMDILEEGSDAWQKAKENWMAAGAEWRSLAEQNLQVITDQYLDSITTIFETLNNNVTNGMGLDYVSKEWELINQNADRYLDQVNSIYETQTLQNKYLDAIENATNPTQQKKLNELMEDEIALLQEKDKLSQYDIDRANLKYEIAMKQMALEESQQKKTQLRLRRDSQGNYTYQYTNDDSEVSKLKNELSDLYNQLYNLDAGQYKSNLDELYSVWEAYQADMYEAAQINDPEERKKREEMLEREYGELINGIVADNESIKQNLQQSTASQLFDLYNQNAENYNQMTEAQKSILDNFISEETNYNNMAFDNLFGLYNENLTAFDAMTQEQIDTLMNDFIPQWDSGVQQMVDTIVGEGGFAQVTKSAMEEIRALAKLWDEERKAAYEEAKAMAEDMQTATQGLAKDNTELISTYQTQLEEVQKVIDKLGELKTAYEQAAAAAKTAAEEAYKYWQAASNKAASTDTTIDTTEYKKPEGDTKDIQKKENSGPTQPTLANGSKVTVKSGATTWASGEWLAGWVKGNNFTVGSISGNKVLLTDPSGPNNWDKGVTGWIKKSDLVGFRSGGYTGDWNNTDGRLAMLHQKELVLNANDTKNILNAVEILRNITSNLGQTLMNQMAGISANNALAIANTIGNDALEQTVHIDAQFPNVTSSNEIETAINNLVNMASQHIQKNR